MAQQACLQKCRLGPPQPVYPPNEYTAPLPRDGVSTGDPNARYDHFRAPRAAPAAYRAA